jgi:hypothetical protein
MLPVIWIDDKNDSFTNNFYQMPTLCLAFYAEFGGVESHLQIKLNMSSNMYCMV